MRETCISQSAPDAPPPPRDPFIERLPDGEGFSLVHTNGWWSRSIVYYRSRTLLDWSEGMARQAAASPPPCPPPPTRVSRVFVLLTPARRRAPARQLLPVMESVDGIKNAWAPETKFDPSSNKVMLYWSSSGDDDYNRIWRRVSSQSLQESPRGCFFTHAFFCRAAFLATSGARACRRCHE